MGGAHSRTETDWEEREDEEPLCFGITFCPRQNLGDATKDRRSVFYDARQSVSKSMIYFPSSVPNTHRRGTIHFDDPETLLSTMEADEGLTIARRSVLLLRELLQRPSVRAGVRGYPGDLTIEELDACLEFRQVLKEKPHCRKMVLCFDDVEEEPYALCRYLRATNFRVKEAVRMLEKTTEQFSKAEAEEFYPTIESAVGCPASVFLTQYPNAYYGNAKNGCPVNYLMAGRIDFNGIDCVTDGEGVKNFIFHSTMYQFTDQVAQAQTSNPDIVRCESVNVLDLKGLNAKQLNKKTLDTIQELGLVSECFPEILNRLIIINAPSFFGFSWKVIKNFLPPRIVNVVEIYTKDKAAKDILLRIIGKDQLIEDYGGNGPSFDELSSKTNGAKRRAFNLMTTKSKRQTVVTLAADETATISVYSKAVSNVSLWKNNEQVAMSTTTGESSAQHRGTEIATNVSGPGELGMTTESSTKAAHMLVYAEVFSSDVDQLSTVDASKSGKLT